MGSAALAGTESVAQSLGFDRPTANSLESVGDRGFALDFLTAGASVALGLSRFGAEVVFWSSQPVGLISLPDELVSSSAALPHKRNPDAAELVRGKSGRVLGNLHTLQTVVKGLPLSYSGISRRTRNRCSTPRTPWSCRWTRRSPSPP